MGEESADVRAPMRVRRDGRRVRAREMLHALEPRSRRVGKGLFMSLGKGGGRCKQLGWKRGGRRKGGTSKRSHILEAISSRK